MPNFLIIGAMKSGTTALYYYLEQHPEIYMSPVKEPNFFACEDERTVRRLPGDPLGVSRAAVTDLKSYRELFDRTAGEKALGEASHSSLYSPKAPANIQRHIPGVKLIAVLRNPVERAYSHFLHSVRTGVERAPDFLRALEEEQRGDRKGELLQDYVGWGLYHGQLRRYYEAFEPSNIRVYLYEDLREAPVRTVRDVFHFLGVDDAFEPDTSLKRNVSGLPRNRLLDRLLRSQHPLKSSLKLCLPGGLRWRTSEILDALKNRNLASPPPLPPETRRYLVDTYREDVARLEGLIGRDLSAWLAYEDTLRASA
jgi:hypothetical protein